MDDKNKINEQDAFDNITSIIKENNEEPQSEPDALYEVEMFGQTSKQKEQAKKLSLSEIPELLKPYLYYIKITGVLVIVSGFIALMLAVVNTVTFDIIEETAAKEKEASVLEIFTGADSVQLSTSETGESDSPKVSVKNIYEVKKGSETVGYCVNVSSIGFGGEIDMMVGTDINNQLVGIKIISMSETPGLGSKASDESFTGQFKGISGTLTVGENIDAVSGATISSKAVTTGVNAVLSLNLGHTADTEKVDTSPQENPEYPEDTDNVDVSVPPIETSPEIETQSPETQPPETETQPPETQANVPVVTTPVETTPPETKPPETTPPETKPPETTPPETKPPETKPPETTPPETKPPETTPPETKPPETTPPETKPPETTPPETKPPETTPPETKPPETQPPVTETEAPETEEENEWRPW